MLASVLVLFLGGAVAEADVIPIGDTLTVIQRPLLNIPAIVTEGDTLRIECEADPATSGWEARLIRGRVEVPLEDCGSAYDASTLWWTLSTRVPEVEIYDMYDLVVRADGGIEDTTWHALRVIPAFKDDYYFVHITDTHLPTHRYYYEHGADTDTSEIVDLREVINDINIINPEFVLLTGDIINEGELEDYLSRRYYTRTQRLMTEFKVPVFLSAGNHDIGGWRDTPPSAGTARRDWWRFFGWKRLDDPPPGAPWYTQNYSFDYGPVHYVGLESYDNYDMWRSAIYGNDSFTSGQMQWLGDDLAAATGSAAQVLFYHYDFSHQINLNSLGVEMALWGHIHSNSGSISSPSYNLATKHTCDGERSYRMVRVSNGVLTPLHTMFAGSSGQKLRVEYEPANDGTNYAVRAEITNYQSERFEHAQLRFLMPRCKGDAEVEVSGGTLLQIDDSDSIATYYVGVDINEFGSQIVSVTLDSTCTDGEDTEDLPDVVWLGQSSPNPFSPVTVLSFGLPTPGRARLEIVDVRGRVVAILVDNDLPAGDRSAIWTGQDSRGRPAAPGVYIARLTSDGIVRTRKIVLAR